MAEAEAELEVLLQKFNISQVAALWPHTVHGLLLSMRSPCLSISIAECTLSY